MIPVVLASVVDTVAIRAATAINAKVGQTFVVALDSNPTTGYSWSVIFGNGGGLFDNVGSTYLRPSSSMPGAGGKQLLLFRALHAGSTDLRLHYVRPFEPSSQNGAKTITFHVVVTP